MAEVKILVEGYTSGDTGGHSCSTIVLIKDKDKNGKVVRQDIDFDNDGVVDMRVYR